MDQEVERLEKDIRLKESLDRWRESDEKLGFAFMQSGQIQDPEMKTVPRSGWWVVETTYRRMNPPHPTKVRVCFDTKQKALTYRYEKISEGIPTDDVETPRQLFWC